MTDTIIPSGRPATTPGEEGLMRKIAELTIRLADLTRTHEATLDRLHEVERDRDALDLRLRRALERIGEGQHTAESPSTAVEAMRTAQAAISRALDACEVYRRGGGIGEVRR